MRIFDPENPFWTYLNKIVDMMLMSLLWLLFSLPIVTIGASTTAFYQFTQRQVTDTEGKIWDSFIGVFRGRFKKATKIWLIWLTGALFLAWELWICWQTVDWSAGWEIAKPVFAGLSSAALIWVISGLYAFPILALFDLPVKKILTNAPVMALGNLPSTIVIAALFTAAAAGCLYFPVLSPFMIGLAVFFSSYLFIHVFRRYATDEETGSENDA